MTRIASNRRSVFGQIQHTKRCEHLLPSKQAITVGSSSGFNVTFLHDWGNILTSLVSRPRDQETTGSGDENELVPVEHVSFDFASWLFVTNARQ